MKINFDKLENAEDAAIPLAFCKSGDGEWENSDCDGLSLHRQEKGLYILHLCLLENPENRHHPDEYRDEDIFDGSLAEFKKYWKENEIFFS